MNKLNSTKQSQIDWAQIDAMTDEDIDFTDLPEVTEEMWEKGILTRGSKPIPRKNQENFPIDRDIIEYFKSLDFNYPAKINQLLREYMESHPVK